MTFFRSKIFFYTSLIQLIGPFLLSLSDWANIIQYLSGFGMAYALWEYVAVHKREIDHLKQQLSHLHEKHDLLHEFLKEDT